MIGQWKIKVQKIKDSLAIIYYATRDSRAPWYAKAVAAVTMAYALSPIDLIPDLIPVIGLLDDLIIVPFGILLTGCLLPKELVEEYRQKLEGKNTDLPISKAGTVIVAVLWLMLLFWMIKIFFEAVNINPS